MKARTRGFVLIAMSITMLLLLAIMGLAFDLGRVYIARNEAQIFTDAAAMTAASKLGRPDAIAQARAAVARLPMRWNLGTREFLNVTVEFSPDGVRWERDPKDVSSITMARVTAPANDVDITFLRAVGGPASFTVPARSVAAIHPVRLVE